MARKRKTGAVENGVVLPGLNERRSWYSEERADEICERLAEGETLIRICKFDAGGNLRPYKTFPSFSTVQHWADPKARGYIPEFMVRFAEARLNQQRYWVEEAVDIADTPEMGVDETSEISEKAGVVTKSAKQVRKDMQHHRQMRIYTRFKAAAMINPEHWSERLRAASLEANKQPENTQIVLVGGLPD
jgi:hypothetical protein